MDQHWLVVFLTDPIILGGKDGWKKKVFFFKSTNLTGDRVEDVAMVVVPALVTQLVRTPLHQAYHIVPDYIVVKNISDWGKFSPDSCKLVWIGVLKVERLEIGGREVPELLLKAAGIDHVAGAGVAWLSWHPGENFFPRGSASSLLPVENLVGAPVGGCVEDKHLDQGQVCEEDTEELFVTMIWQTVTWV